jgi:hypothetical protein
MARIRSLKPEAFQSETLAEISLAAERSFYGLSTLADDHGRFADKPAQINGDLWSMRNARTPSTPHTPEDLEDELGEMGEAKLICRYAGCDGKRYGHFITWTRHQKIDKVSKPRYPRCPHHPAPRDDECGIHGKESCPLQECPGGLSTVSRGFESVSEAFSGPLPTLGEPRGAGTPEPVESLRETVESAPRIASDLVLSETSRGFEEGSRDSREGSAKDLGSRTEGSKEVPPSAGASPPRRRRDPPPERHIGTVVAAYVDGATGAGLDAPSPKLRARIGRQAREMLVAGSADLDRLIESARNLGASEFNDLDVQVRRDGARAKGLGGSSPPPAPASVSKLDRGRALVSTAALMDEEAALAASNPERRHLA